MIRQFFILSSVFLALIIFSPVAETSAQSIIAQQEQLITYAEGRRNVQMFGNKTAKNVWISTDVMTYPSKHAGVVFRGNSRMSDYYECYINVDRGIIELFVYINGSRKRLKAHRISSLSQRRQYQLWVGMFGNRISVYLDGTYLFSVDDNRLNYAGLVGTMTYYKGATFRNFVAYGYN